LMMKRSVPSMMSSSTTRPLRRDSTPYSLPSWF
jgi:hypothetical protein